MSQKIVNRRYILASRPSGLPTTENVQLREEVLEAPTEGFVTLKNSYISLDPAIRGWMSDAPSYVEPIPLGDAVRSTLIGRVVASSSKDFQVGDLAFGLGGWELYSTMPAEVANKLDESKGVSHSHYLSILGLTGMTAYFGLLNVGKPQAGETVLVSAAAGAVGSVVGQIAKLKGLSSSRNGRECRKMSLVNQ